MRTIEINVYQFDELSTEAQERALEKCRLFEVNYNWWEFIYEDAAQVGLKIEGFCLDASRKIEAEFTEGPEATAALIIETHGENCDTYKAAQEYTTERAELVTKYSDGTNTDRVAEGNEAEFDEDADYVDREFLNTLRADYWSMLEKEYEYRTSDEVVKECIQANGYEFTEEGEIY